MSISDDFTVFWNSYPRRIGKLAAIKAYEKARRSFSEEEILQGLGRYLEHLPNDPQFICHATTWLNQGRWMDEYTTPQKPKATLGIYKPYVPLKDRVR